MFAPSGEETGNSVPKLVFIILFVVPDEAQFALKSKSPR
jgi:hypothetical protein